MDMQHLALIALGGAIGACGRHVVGLVALRLLGTAFPYGTLFVNVSGSLAMGLAAGVFALRSQGGEAMRLFLMTGILGGYTTFSAFSLESVLLWERGQGASATLYVGASVISSIAALVAGLAISRLAG